MSDEKGTLLIKLEILTASFYEHHKYSEDLAKFLSHLNPKRVRLQEQLNEMVGEIEELRQKLKDLES